MSAEILNITAEESGERIDALLARMVPELTRSAAQRLIEEGRVTFSGAPVKKNRRTDMLSATVPFQSQNPVISSFSFLFLRSPPPLRLPELPPYSAVFS